MLQRFNVKLLKQGRDLAFFSFLREMLIGKHYHAYILTHGKAARPSSVKKF